MINVISLYQDAVDALLAEANGELTFELFNRYSRLAELDVIDWITGDIRGNEPPEPYLTQKNKDWCAPFIKKELKQVVAGSVPFPKDYYGFENMYMLGSYGKQKTECADIDPSEPYDVNNDTNTVIDLLDGDPFTVRCNTYIEGLAPSFTKPIAKVVGKTFEYMPKDLGSIGIEYYRYPVFAFIKTTFSDEFHQEVADPATSQNYEWDEKVRGILLYFIVDRFSNRTSNSSMKQFNNATGKTPKG